MKKTYLLFFCILILLIIALCACSTQKKELQEPVSFYYASSDITYNSPTGVISSEIREGVGYHGNLSAFLHAYLRGPASSNLENVFPSDVYLVSCEIEEQVAKITLSAQLSNLSELKLTTACSALLMTVHEYTGVDTICIQAKGEKLDGKDAITLSMDDVIFIDTVE